MSFKVFAVTAICVALYLIWPISSREEMQLILKYYLLRDWYFPPLMSIREAAKKVIFLMAVPLWLSTPPPSLMSVVTSPSEESFIIKNLCIFSQFYEFLVLFRALHLFVRNAFFIYILVNFKDVWKIFYIWVQCPKTRL